MKAAKTEVVANSDVTSGPKYCEGDQTTPDPNGETDSMRVMSYNLYGWNAIEQNPWKAEYLYKAIRLINPDILGAQEVSKENEVAENIGSDYALAGAPSAGHVVFYRTSVLTFQDKGVVELNEMDQYGTVGYLCNISLDLSVRPFLFLVEDRGVRPLDPQAVRS